MLSALLLAACGGKKAEQKSASELIADADHFQLDTIAVDPADTLVSSSVDHVLRHYPELFRAAEKARKMFLQWVAQEQQSPLKTQPDVLDISDILTETFSASDLSVAEGGGEAPAFSSETIRAEHSSPMPSSCSKWPKPSLPTSAPASSPSSHSE